MTGAPTMISVVMPAHDRAPVIGFQLDALARQTTSRPYEVIVADNGSSDDTVAVAESFADRFERFKVIDASARAGAGPARNIGAAAAAGEMIAFCDSDDIVHHDWLEALAAAWRPGTMVAGRVVHDRDLDDDHVFAEVPARPPRTRIDVPCLVQGGNMAIGRADLERLGGFDESFRYSQDTELSWRGQLAGLDYVEAVDALTFKRSAPTRRAELRQHYRWGRTRPRLYRRYRAEGFERRSPRALVRGYAKLMGHAALSPLDVHHRDMTVRMTGHFTGYIVGSVKYRVVHL